MGITDHIHNSGKKRKRARGTKRRGAESEMETILESEEVDAEEVDAINGLLQTDEVEPEIKGAIGNAD